MGANSRVENCDFQILGPDFDSVALKLIMAAGPCSIAQTLGLRRETLQDDHILNYLSANSLRVIFNVLLTRKILQMNPAVNEMARHDRFEQLLPPLSENYAENQRERDREILENSFVQARVTDLCRVLSPLAQDENPIADSMPSGAVRKIYTDKIRPILAQLDLSLEATLQDSGFESAIIGVNNLMMVFPVAVIMHMRRLALEDDELSASIHPNQLRILFNIWLTQKIRGLEEEAFHQAREENFNSLLPIYDREGADEIWAADRDTLNYAFAQARMTNLGIDEIEKHKLSVPEAYLSSASATGDGKAQSPDGFGGVFTSWFTPYVMDLLNSKLQLMVTENDKKNFLLSDAFAKVFLDRFFPKLVLPHMDRNIEAMATSFELHAKTAKLKLGKLSDETSREQSLKKFLESDGAEEFHEFLSKSAMIVREFPQQLGKAKKVISEHKESSEKQGAFSKLFKGEDKNLKSRAKDGKKYLAVEQAFHDAASRLEEPPVVRLDETDFALLGDFVEKIDPARIDMLYKSVEYEIFKPSGDTKPGAALTDTLCKIFRDEETDPLEIGIILTQMIYRRYPFNLEYIDTFFQNNARFSKEKVIGAYPYLKNAMVWELKSQASRLAELADQDDESAFDEEVQLYKVSRRVALVMEMRGPADKIAKDLSSKPLDLPADRRRYWEEKKLPELRPA